MIKFAQFKSDKHPNKFLLIMVDDETAVAFMDPDGHWREFPELATEMDQMIAEMVDTGSLPEWDDPGPEEAELEEINHG